MQGGALAGNGNSPPSAYHIVGNFRGIQFSRIANRQNLFSRTCMIMPIIHCTIMFVHGFTDSENCKNWTPRKISRYTVVLDSYSQVNELEGELPLQKMQLSQVVKEKDSLQKQLDTLTAQLANSEGQVGREKIKASTLQVYTCTFTHYVWDSFKLC